jgi:hypothetical protein
VPLELGLLLLLLLLLLAVVVVVAAVVPFVGLLLLLLLVLLLLVVQEGHSCLHPTYQTSGSHQALQPQPMQLLLSAAQLLAQPGCHHSVLLLVLVLLLLLEHRNSQSPTGRNPVPLVCQPLLPLLLQVLPLLPLLLLLLHLRRPPLELLQVLLQAWEGHSWKRPMCRN